MRRNSAAMIAAVVLLGAAPFAAGCGPSARATYYGQRDRPVPSRAGDGEPLAAQPTEMFDLLAQRRLSPPTAVSAVGE